jgi:hypothetical protein
MARVQDVVGDTFRSIGQKLLPKLTDLGNWLAARASPRSSSSARSWRPNWGRSTGPPSWARPVTSPAASRTSSPRSPRPSSRHRQDVGRPDHLRRPDRPEQRGLGSARQDPRRRPGQGHRLDGSGCWRPRRPISRFFGSVDWEAVGRTAGKTAFPFAIGFAMTLFDGLFDAAKNHPMDVALFILAFIPLGKLASAFGPVKNLIEKLPFGEWITKALGATAGKAWDAIVALRRLHVPRVQGRLRRVVPERVEELQHLLPQPRRGHRDHRLVGGGEGP